MVGGARLSLVLIPRHALLLLYYSWSSIYVQMLEERKQPIPTQDKKQLIQSMKKLVTHVSNNPQRQIEIFRSLGTNDLLKVFANLADENEYLRRVSALFLCELLYNNDRVREEMMKTLEIYPCSGRICLGGIPQSIHRYPSTLKKCVEIMNAPSIQLDDDKICWIINLERKNLKLQHMEYKKYSSFTFIDPGKNIFGVTFSANQSGNQKIALNHFVQNPINATDVYPPSTLSRYQQTNPKESRYAVNHIQDHSSKQRINNEFYKSYIEARNRSKDSKRASFQNGFSNMSINHQEHLDKYAGYLHPSTGRQNVNPYPSLTSETQYQSGDNRPNTIQSISQYARNSYGNSRARPSIQESSRPVQIRERNSMLQRSRDQRFTGSFQQMLKERRIESRSRERQDFSKIEREGYNEHDRFYRRVKDILRR